MRRSLLPLTLACLAAQTASQGGPPPGGPSVAPAPKIWIGDGVTSFGSFSAPDQSAFTAALRAYGGKVHEIEVLPGTYVFESTIALGRPGMRLYGSPGAVIQTHATLLSGPLFRADAGDVTFDGLTFRETRDVEEGLVLVMASGASVVGCTFDLVSAPAMGAAPALELVGSAGMPLGSALVRDNLFRFHPQPPGFGHAGLRATSCRSIRIYGNRFTGTDLGTPSPVRRAITLESCAWSTVVGNVVNATLAPQASDPLIQLQASGPSAAAISGNYLEDVSGSAIVALQGSSSRFAVTGNALGRTFAASGSLFVDEAAGAVIVGNQLHNGPSILADSAADVLVSDNTFGLAHSAQIELTDTLGATCVGNRFEADGATGTAAIDLGSASNTLVVGNLSHGGFTHILVGAPDVGDGTNTNL